MVSTMVAKWCRISTVHGWTRICRYVEHSCLCSESQSQHPQTLWFLFNLNCPALSAFLFNLNTQMGVAQLNRSGKPQVVVHVSTYQGAILEFRFFEPHPNVLSRRLEIRRAACRVSSRTPGQAWSFWREVHFAARGCSAGRACSYCHAEHPKRPPSLDKAWRSRPGPLF